MSQDQQQQNTNIVDLDIFVEFVQTYATIYAKVTDNQGKEVKSLRIDMYGKFQVWDHGEKILETESASWAVEKYNEIGS